VKRGGTCWRLLAVITLALLALTSVSCGGTRGAGSAQPALSSLRDKGQSSRDPEVVARWLLGELISPGGDAKQAARARKRLDQLGGKGMLAELARGLDDSTHGRLRSAPDHFLGATQAARVSKDPRAPFIAWFAAHKAMVLRDNAPDLYKRWKPFVADAMKAPLGMGWRARGELVDWWANEAYEAAKKNVEDLSAEQFGCVKHLRLAGPFGRGATPDSHRHFAAEKPGPWPTQWDPEPGIGHAPHVLHTKRHGCYVGTDEPVTGGIFYAETYVDLPSAQELMLSAQGMLAMWVDDQLVVDRDPRVWGNWPHFGTQLWLDKGRHRILVRLADPETSIRVLYPGGRPYGADSSTDAAAPYSIVPPRVTRDPNILDRYIKNDNVVDPDDDLLRYIGAYLTDVEGQGDVASVWIEPLVEDPPSATGASLSLAASFVDDDPIFDSTQAKDLVRALHERAVAKDPGLWRPELALALWEVQRAGAASGVRRVKALVDSFPEVPAVLSALSRLYAQLGWETEYVNAVKRMVKRFPRDVDVLAVGVEVYDSIGETKKANALVERIHKLDPDHEIVLTRALAREDYKTALSELKRIGKRRPERKDIAERVYDVMARAGNASETWKKLEEAIKQKPKSGSARLALADAEYAAGKHGALRKALVEAVVKGANSAPLKDALDLVEGMSELAPYRLDAMPIIHAYEKSGRHMPGTAARILDYSAVWVHSDGSSRLLEHEIIRIQSAEAVSKLSEERRPAGLILHMRVIKKDGRILQPELVAGKPTVTFPHLEVGDYIETEHITSTQGDGQHGQHYLGPHWFFREQNIAYARSEFVVITPEDKKLIVETHGKVPAPAISRQPGLVTRRWRVDFSPAAPVEPNSAPITEFLPSVQVGWGIDLEQRLRSLGDSVAVVTPVDPRITRIAHSITKGVPASARTKQALRLYRWVLANVETGAESDGRRVIIGKHGNRWRGFMTLCRSLDIPVRYAIAKNRLVSPPVGPISKAGQFTDPLLRLQGDKGPVWLTVSSKYAPFGYVPAELRGTTAYLLGGDHAKELTTPGSGTQDSVVYQGTVKLATDGSAKIQLSQSFYGKYAMALRSVLSQLPEGRLHDVIESRLLGRELRGARLEHYSIQHRDDLDAPLVIQTQATMSGFAQQSGNSLVVSPPFAPRISQLTTLPARQTPLLIGEATHQEVRLTIQLPKGAHVESTLAPGTIKDADRSVIVKDSFQNGALVLDRVIDIPAGRTQPADYPAFVQFARQADDAVSSNIRVRAR